MSQRKDFDEKARKKAAKVEIEEKKAAKKRDEAAKRIENEAKKAREKADREDREKEEMKRRMQIEGVKSSIEWRTRQIAATRPQPVTEETMEEIRQTVIDEMGVRGLLEEQNKEVLEEQNKEVSAEQKEEVSEGVKKEPALAVQKEIKPLKPDEVEVKIRDYVITIIENLYEAVQKNIENSKTDIMKEIVQKYPGADQKALEDSLLKFWPSRIKSLIQDIRNSDLKDSLLDIITTWRSEHFSRKSQGAFFDIVSVKESVNGFLNALDKDAGIRMFISDCNNKNLNPLYEAVKTGNLRYVNELIVFGYDPNEKVNGEAPLNLAVRNAIEGVKSATGFGFVDPKAISKETVIIQALLDGEAKPNTRDKNGDTPLHHLAKSSKDIPEEAMQSIVAPLLKAGAIQELKNKKGQTPRDIEEANKKAVVEEPVIPRGRERAKTTWERERQPPKKDEKGKEYEYPSTTATTTTTITPDKATTTTITPDKATTTTITPPKRLSAGEYIFNVINNKQVFKLAISSEEEMLKNIVDEIDQKVKEFPKDPKKSSFKTSDIAGEVELQWSSKKESLMESLKDAIEYPQEDLSIKEIILKWKEDHLTTTKNKPITTTHVEEYLQEELNAAFAKKIEQLVNYVLDYGSPDIQDQLKKKPNEAKDPELASIKAEDLCDAVKKGDLTSVKIILQRRTINPNYAEEGTGLTPLHLAVINAEAMVTDKLSMFVDLKKDTPHLQDLIKTEAVIFRELLNDKNVDLNKKDEDGNTALHLAAKIKNPVIAKAIVTSLLEAGVDYTSKNKNGETAEDIAKVKNNEKVVGILQKHATAGPVRPEAVRTRERASTIAPQGVAGTQDEGKKRERAVKPVTVNKNYEIVKGFPRDDQLQKDTIYVKFKNVKGLFSGSKLELECKLNENGVIDKYTIKGEEAKQFANQNPLTVDQQKKLGRLIEKEFEKRKERQRQLKKGSFEQQKKPSQRTESITEGAPSQKSLFSAVPSGSAGSSGPARPSSPVPTKKK